MSISDIERFINEDEIAILSKLIITPRVHSTRSSLRRQSQNDVSVNETTTSLNIPFESINAGDVLLGRGKRCHLHPGNTYFRELVSRMAYHYNYCCKCQKTVIAQAIVDTIHKKGGKFLTPTSKAQEFWSPVNGLAIRTKASQALRDSSNHWL